MGKQFYFDRKSYFYLKPSEEEITTLIVEYLKKCPHKTAGMTQLEKDLTKIYQEVYHKTLYTKRWKWGLALLMAVRRPPLIQAYEIKRKRYIKLLL